MNLWTEWCYWHRDSILKQTIILLDKTGLRKKGNAGKHIKRFNGRKSNNLTSAEKKNQAIQNALNYGIGYKQYKKEVDAIRARRIMERLERKNSTNNNKEE